MKLTKEDYMLLPKERLAELLAEIDEERRDNNIPYMPTRIYPSDGKTGPCIDGGPCNNPFHDCVNCPGMFNTGGYATTTTMNINDGGQTGENEGK